MTDKHKRRHSNAIMAVPDKALNRAQITELIDGWGRERIQAELKAFNKRATGTTADLRRRLLAVEDSNHPKSERWYWG